MALKGLFRPRWKHSDPFVRMKAVKKLKDQGILAEIAKNDKDVRVRRQAVWNLKDQEVLKEIAKNDKEIPLRQAAIEKLKDQVVLEEIAKNDKEKVVRQATIDKIKDQDLLEGKIEYGPKEIKKKKELIRNCSEILDDITKNEEHARDKIEAISTLASLSNDAEAIDSLLLTLKNEERGEIAITAAVAIACNLEKQYVEDLIFDQFRKMKNIKKIMGQSPQVRILYVILFSNAKQLLYKLQDDDFSDDISGVFKSKRDNLIKYGKKNNISEMCKTIMWFEGIDVACNHFLLVLASQFFPTHRKFFKELIPIPIIANQV